MSKLVGIDIRPSAVRVAVLRTTYRRVHIEALYEVERAAFETLGDALRTVAAGAAQHGEPIALGLDGKSAFIHRLALPPAVLRQVEEVLPFEIEARIPVDFDQLVYDSRVLPRARNESNVDVVAVAAPIALVRERIELSREALGHEPEHIGVGAVSLGNLSAVLPELRGDQYCVVLDVGEAGSELAIVHQGMTVFARSLSTGLAGLPESGPELVSAIRQTLVAWGAHSDAAVTRLFLCGGGSQVAGMADFLAEQLEVEVSDFAEPQLTFESPEQASSLPVFAKALALALALRAGAKDLNLRQGELSYARGYGFLKEKIPLLAGLGAALLASFVFSSWAESRALDGENAAMAAAMAQLSKQILQEESEVPGHVLDLLDTGLKVEKDPQPEFDGFRLALTLTKHIPLELEHVVEELDLQRNHVKLRGVVKSTEAAQQIAENLKSEPCFKDVNISKISQQVRSDRQKYALEFDIRCEDEQRSRATTTSDEEAG